MKQTFFRFYKREIIVILSIALLIFLIRLIVVYHRLIAQYLFSEKGMMILLGLVIAGVAAQAIRLYYRVIIIKYTLLLTLVFIVSSCHSGTAAATYRDPIATRAFARMNF